MSLQASVSALFNILLTGATDLSAPQDAINRTINLATLATGAALNQANGFWADTRTLNAGTSENISMNAPSARDSIGQTISWTKIKAIYIKNRSTTVGDILRVGGEGSTAAWSVPFNGVDTALEVVGPDGAWLKVEPSAAGMACAAGTDELLKINNPGSNAISYDIIIIGA